ncbi:Rho termination factor [Arthrobacter sp. 7749]|nr:Rho termination factor [Arthrobacter sp. 7749]
MPKQDNQQIKDEELYEKLREEGKSKQKSARIANAAARDGRKKVAQRGGESGDYEDWTVPQLRTRAREIGLRGYSKQRKSQLINSLRNS